MPSSLFTPVRINGLVVKNRTVMAPMSPKYASLDGQVTERLMAYYERRAKGGVGLLIVEATYIERDGAGSARALGVDADDKIPGLRQLAARIKAHGAAAALQLNHCGRTSAAAVTGSPAKVVSIVPGVTQIKDTRELTRAEITDLAAAFGAAATRAQKAGFDAVELHGSHGYLLSQFLSGYTNKRQDEYGGNLENRMRFPLEVLAAVRSAVGPDFPVTYRMTGEEGIAGGITQEEGIALAKALVLGGIDALHVSVGIGERREYITAPAAAPRGWKVHLATAVKQAIENAVPVIAVGRLVDGDQAKEIVDSGKADMVAFGRALIADPDLPAKVERGDDRAVIRCIACNDGCIGRTTTGGDLLCTVNPQVGFEARYAEEGRAASPKRVLIAGGGPTGMQAAITAARRGHSVTLYEQRETLGGQLPMAGTPPHKQDLFDYGTQMARRVTEAGARVVTGVPLTAAMVAQEAPDHVLVATGSLPIVPDFCAALPNAVTAEAVLAGDAAAGRRVVVIGGGMVGVETAEFLAEKGHTVAIVEMRPAIAADMEIRVKTFLFNNFKRLNVGLHAGTQFVGCDADGVVTVKGAYDRQWILGTFDTIVLAIGHAPVLGLARDLTAAGIPHTLLGDCLTVGKIMEAQILAMETAEKL